MKSEAGLSEEVFRSFHLGIDVGLADYRPGRVFFEHHF